ncbi:conserved hypothetical protein, secreted [Candidatus Thiomargarita nelsonii]|uniref:Uncharacterized protein n=1 Tax=Candidatus Thiomargarita nelsonii TaxID=1003181 RepID=A0A176RVX8_9GAMM|nr:conserved hypothetical protein, secreted [Candidatus Thiomargarita nelsonii]
MYIIVNKEAFIMNKLSFLWVGVIALQASVAYAGTQTYTVDADFDLGVMVGVEHSTPDQLQLSTVASVLPFIWIANSGENTVSKIDTVTGCELGRYLTGPGNEDPSRTTVDINGDLWVGNRESNTATKFLLNPPAGATSQPDNVDCTINPASVLPWGTDVAMALRINVDSGPRALAVDALNNVWIGGSGQNMGYYNGTTGIQIKNIHVGRTCYGALIDGNGTLWVSNKNTAYLTRIDNPDAPGNGHTMSFIPTGDGWVYGISIDQQGYIYTSGYTNNRLRQLDPATNTWNYSVSISGGGYGRGVAVGLDGDVWVAHSSTHRVTRHNAADGSLIATVGVGNTPTGVATAADGKIWVTNYNSNSVMRIDPNTNLEDFTRTGHTSPYNYSDMTGIISRNITTKIGTWTVSYQEAGVCHATVSWTDDTPEDSTITVTAESSEDNVNWSDAEQIQDGVEFPTVENAEFIRLVVEFSASTGIQETPILYDLTIDTTSCNPCDDVANCTLIGTNGADVLIGTIGDDVICGLDGNDSLYGSSGTDILCGGDGNDKLYGDSGTDWLQGGAGNDRLYGGTSDDLLEGGDGDDRHSGGSGSDTCIDNDAGDSFSSC